MEKINLSKLNSINFGNKEVSKNKEEVKPLEEKKAEASSLDAMSSYGRAMVNMSFKGNIDKKPLSDKTKTNKNDEIKQNCLENLHFNKNSKKYSQAQKLLSNEKVLELINDKKISNHSINTLSCLEDKYFKNANKLLQNDRVMELLKSGVFKCHNIEEISKLDSEQCDNIIKFISDENIVKLLESKTINAHILTTIFKPGKDYNIKRIQDFFSDSTICKLFENKRILNYEIALVSGLKNHEYENLKKILTQKNTMQLIANKQLNISYLEKYARETKNVKKISTLLADDRIADLINQGFLEQNRLELCLELENDSFKNAYTMLTSDALAPFIENTKFDMFKSGRLICDIIDLSTLTPDKVKAMLKNVKEVYKLYGDKYDIEINKSETENDAIITASKTQESSDNPKHIRNLKDYVKVTKTITRLSNGKDIKSTTYRDAKGNEESWLADGNKTLIINKKTGKAYSYDDKPEKYDAANTQAVDINYQMEIVNNKLGKPDHIIYTKESPYLAGAYETTKYNLKDYPRNMNVISAIKNGTINGGEKLSTVKRKNGLTTYTENYEQNGNITKRDYSEQADKDGNLSSIKYQYEINDKSGNSLLSLNRSWDKNKDGTTTTTINGKTYITKFNDKKMEITITQDDGTEKIINLKDKLTPLSEYTNDDKKYILNTYGSEKAMQEKFFNFVKTLPADEIISLGLYPSEINIVEPLESAIGISGELYTGCNKSVLAHELGHAFDKFGCGRKSKVGSITSNKEVINTYNKEINKFRREYPQEAQEIINYFTQYGAGSFNGGSQKNSGLSELVAETNMLMSTYGSNEKTTQTRSEYLVKYFPETVAKIGKLLGY